MSSERKDNPNQPDFNGWDLRESKTSLIGAVVKPVSRGGVRAIAAITSMVGILWIGHNALTSGSEGAQKLIALTLIVGAVSVIAITAILFGKFDHGTPEEGPSGSPKSGGVSKRKAAP